jgi:hypothetical protein
VAAALLAAGCAFILASRAADGVRETDSLSSHSTIFMGSGLGDLAKAGFTPTDEPKSGNSASGTNEVRKKVTPRGSARR